MHFLKHCVALFTAPLMLALMSAMAAAAFRLRGHRRASAALVALAIAIAYAGSTAVIGDSLLGPLEREYPPLREDQTLPAVKWIVVLGSDYSPRAGISVTAALDSDALARIVEGVRLARKYPGMKLLVSGGAPAGRIPPARGYAELARDLGIEDSSLLVSDKPLDTGEEARAVAALLGNQPFLLVTSAYHMPRAMRQMRRAGARAFAAPAQQLVNPAPGIDWRVLLPNSAGLRKTERAIHEYLGFLAMAAGIN
jgi:uncharacterized SAM-binding protein YcdF (DUF218 family)